MPLMIWIVYSCDANCAFSTDEGCGCAFEYHNMSITEPVHMKFKETYPELFI